MLQELIYTSAPAGLKAGSQGLCTVACTTGMPSNLVKLLETMSGYRHVFLPPDPNASQNPAACSHLLLNLGGVPRYILSRTADAGLDYTQKPNKISHHLVLDKAELQEAGPTAVLTQYPFQTSWNQKPVLIPANKKLPPITSQVRLCEQWAKLTGDAGWGGILAETALTKQPVSIIFRPGMAMLPLLDEAMALLPPEVRWQVSFSTYSCNLPEGTGCQWKCILAGSPEMAQVRLYPNTLVIDLTQGLGAPPNGKLVEAARTGILPLQSEGIIPLAVQDGDQVVYDIKDAGGPPQVAVVPTEQVKVKPKSDKDKQKKTSGDDVTSKGCFWLIIVFFILVTAGLIGGLFMIYGSNLTQKQGATLQGKTISELQTKIDELERQIADDKVKQEQLADENALWQKEKDEYDIHIAEEDKYIHRVAGYFSLFPQVSLPPVTVNLRTGIPRKDGEQEPQSDLYDFGGKLDRTWNLKEMLAVRVTCFDGKVSCERDSQPAIYSSGNEFLGYSWRLYDKQTGKAIAEFEVIVTENGISVRRFNDDTWHRLVEEDLKRLYEAAKDDADGGFQLNDKLIGWYETDVKDKTFMLDETMLTKITEYAPDIFSGEYAGAARLLELRKDFYEGSIQLQFDFDLKLNLLTDKVEREKP